MPFATIARLLRSTRLEKRRAASYISMRRIAPLSRSAYRIRSSRFMFALIHSRRLTISRTRLTPKAETKTQRRAKLRAHNA